MKVFCVDIGYSLKADLEKWENNHMSYAGHILYGINHMFENGIEPVFEIGKHGFIYGKWYAFIDEFIKAFSLLLKAKDIDAIYIPHSYYSKWIVVLRKLHLIRVPVIVCMHNKNNLRGFIYACDKVVTINPYLYKCLQERYPTKKADIHLISLAPENIIVDVGNFEEKVDVISIGNTKRDFEILIKAMRRLPYTCKIISGNFTVKEELPNNVKVINEKLLYEECLKEYANAQIIAIPLSKDVGEGVFGLTSLVDALTVGKPIVITKTKGIGVPVQEWGCGIEAEDDIKMADAIKKILEDRQYREKIEKNITEIKKGYNMKQCSKELCNIIKQMKK